MSGVFLSNKADGSPRWEITDRTPRVTQLIQPGIFNGSVTVPGVPFWAFYNPDASENAVRPVISVSGSTIYWTWGSPGSGVNATNLSLIVGAY